MKRLPLVSGMSDRGICILASFGLFLITRRK